MKGYTVVFEQAAGNYSAYVPDLPGCISTGLTLDECERNIRSAIGLYLETLRDDGQEAPPPRTTAREVTVDAA